MLSPRQARYMRLWAAQDGLCALCGERMPPLQPKNKRHGWTFDHVWPRRYGFRDRGSVVLAHGRCNRFKADRDPTGCEILLLAAVNARIGDELTIRDNSVLDLRDEFAPRYGMHDGRRFVARRMAA